MKAFRNRSRDPNRPSNGYAIRFDHRLVESAVLLAETRLNPFQKTRFRRDRNSCYEVDDPTAREQEFSSFHRRWFDGMELERPVLRTLDEYPKVRSGTERCLVLSANRAGDEHADLRDETVDDDPVRAGRGIESRCRPSVFIYVRPEVVADSFRFESLLARELLHVADMLDPEFGYDTEVPALDGGPAQLNQVRDRYRVLWDCTIDGRVSRAGKGPDGVVGMRRREFAAAFPELGRDTEERFRFWWEASRPNHIEMMSASIAFLPAATSRTCPLCRFPYAKLYPDAARLSEHIVEAIHADFPSWTVDQGLCLPCAGLYEAHLART